MRLGDATSPERLVRLDVFEAATENRYPWSQYDPNQQKVLRYGHCPECHGAMQLINIENPNPQKVPHGRHRLKHVEGFDYCLERILGCSKLKRSKKQELETENTILTQDAIQRRSFLVENFNLVAVMFAEETGISLYRKQFKKILQIYLENGWYRWTTATCGNLPWLFGRVTFNFSLYGQTLAKGSPLRAAVLSQIPSAGIGPREQLLRTGTEYFTVEFGLREHVVRQDAAGNTRETITLHVHRKGVRSLPDAKIYEEVLEIKPDVFLRRVARKTEPNRSGAALLEMARDTLADYLARHPEAREPSKGAS